MSTVALTGSEGLEGRGRIASALALADLPVVLLALPVFIVGDFPIAGWAVCAGAWLFTRVLQGLASRRTAQALARGDRRSAMGFHAAAMLARIWIVALAVLVVGLAEREAGLAAAVMAAVLVSFYLGGGALSHLLAREPQQ